MKTLKNILIGLGSALALASPALAQDGLKLTATPASAEVEVGQRIELTVKLTNTGESAVELYELAQDRMVVSFDVQIDDGKTFIFEKITSSADDPNTAKVEWAKASLGPGESWELAVGMPALTAGTFTVKAVYARPARKPLTAPGSDWELSPAPASPTVEAEPVAIAIKPVGDKNDLELRIVTTAGPMRARLFPRDALGTCLHFANLVQVGTEINGKLRRPFYDGLIFHRVMPGFMIQGGDPKGDGTGGPGYAIPAEFALGDAPDHLKHHPGSLSMARSNHPDSAGCQFFVTVGSPAHLNGQYTCFGEVTRGLDVAYSIADVDAVETLSGEKSKPLERIEIRSVTLRPIKR